MLFTPASAAKSALNFKLSGFSKKFTINFHRTLLGRVSRWLCWPQEPVLRELWPDGYAWSDGFLLGALVPCLLVMAVGYGELTLARWEKLGKLSTSLQQPIRCHESIFTCSIILACSQVFPIIFCLVRRFGCEPFFRWIIAFPLQPSMFAN
jgi:hypothetical protein